MKAIPLPKLPALGALAAAIVVALIVAGVARKTGPADVRLVSVNDAGREKHVIVEFRKSDPTAHFSERQKMQIRVAGGWQRPEPFGMIQDGSLLERTNREQVIFTFPAETDACRFLFTYRAGQSHYCQTYFFLQKHGLLQRFPGPSRAVLKLVREHVTLKRAEFELMLPAGAHDSSS